MKKALFLYFLQLATLQKKKKKIGKNHRQKIAAFSSQVFGQASQWISGCSLLNLVAS